MNYLLNHPWAATLFPDPYSRAEILHGMFILSAFHVAPPEDTAFAFRTPGR
jgi:hypothetical protein